MSLEMMITRSKKHVPSGAMDYDTFKVWLAANTNKVTQDQATVTPQGRYDPSGYLYITMPTSPTGTMWGTPYKGLFTHDSPLGRVVQHALPPAVYDEVRTANRICMMRLLDYGVHPTYTSITRNGYTSSNYGSFRGYHCDDFVYYDASSKLMMRYNPLTDSAPVIFDGSLVA